MQLQLSTWPEVEAYLETSVGILMPIGSTEQHGPSGLIGTDAICAEVIARAAGERLGAMVGPSINVGMAQHHMAFTGSMTLRPSTLIALMRDCVASLAKHGFRRVYFVNGHGGNTATIGAAFDEIYADSSLGGETGVRCKSVNWWMGTRVRKLRESLYAGREGAHATPSEIAVTWFAYPGEVREVVLEKAAPPMQPFADAEDYRRRFPDGRIGSDPSLANATDGERLIEAAATDIAENYKTFLGDG